jgi:hypothetical protein
MLWPTQMVANATTCNLTNRELQQGRRVQESCRATNCCHAARDQISKACGLARLLTYLVVLCNRDTSTSDPT